jgi:hypothetical protein
VCALVFTGILGAFLAVGVWLGGPGIAGQLIEGSLSDAGFHGEATSVEVETDEPWDLLNGRLDRVTISSERASIDQLEAERLQLVLLDADFGGGFSQIDGRLDGVTLRAADGTTVHASSVVLSGAPGAVQAQITIDGAEVERLALAEVERQTGVSIGSTSLREPDIVAFSILFITVEGRFLVEPDGALGLSVALPGNPQVRLIADSAITIESVAVRGDQLVLVGSLNLPALDGG